MIKILKQLSDSDNVGAKAAMLGRLTSHGFSVPDGFVLDQQVYAEFIQHNQLDQKIFGLLETLTKESITFVSQTIQEMIQRGVFEDRLLEELSGRLSCDQLYAIRSSGAMEDLADHSFAGQYESFLGIQGLSEIVICIKACYQSMFSETNLNYLVDHQLSPKNLTMSVIVQEFIVADYSGVAFTLNPVSGDDSQIVIEVAQGRGDHLVGGYVEAISHCYNWRQNSWQEKEEWLISQKKLTKFAKVFLAIQVWLGYPCDIEFAIKEEELVILQVRAITAIYYGGISGQWTTANFRDGGVSAQICSPFMWSLYESVWDQALGRFLVEGKINQPHEFGPLLRYDYGRLYWNVGVVKRAMAKFPGYNEKDFDNELGITKSYTGEGQQTRLSLKLLWPILQMALVQKKRVKVSLGEAETRRNELLKTYELASEKLTNLEGHQLASAWRELIEVSFPISELTYFQQVYLNTVEQTLFKEKIVKHLDYQDYLILLGGLDQVSHLLPYQEMWAISRRIQQEPAAQHFWQEHSSEEINAQLEQGKSFPTSDSLTQLIARFGYHSSRELNIEYESYSEDPTFFIQHIQALVLLDESYSPAINQQRQYEDYQSVLAKLRQQLPARKMKGFEKDIAKMRELLWWREELRDISTRYYSLIRHYSLKLACWYQALGLLEKTADIWYLEHKVISHYSQGLLSQDQFQAKLKEGRTYYQGYRHFKNPEDIGTVYQEGRETVTATSLLEIKGIGCNKGQVTGVARVIESVADIHDLQPEEILVTRFTDTGWTSKFAILKGIVTETGGVLCHAAICAREYGIPCIVCANQATEIIKTGMLITIDGATGEVKVIAEKGN